jgi:hypothetical protein
MPDLAYLTGLLDQAGLPRLAGALRVRLKGPPTARFEIRGTARPDPELWKTGKINW